jgi:hypothetical protein
MLYRLSHVIVSGMVSACASGGAATPNDAPPAQPMVVYANVENQNEFPAVIFAYRGGQWTQLGLVEPGRTKILPFTWNRPEVRFVIELVGNDDIAGLSPEDDGRKVFAGDVHGSVPCHLTGPSAVEHNLSLILIVEPDIKRNAGGSRCQPRR